MNVTYEQLKVAHKTRLESETASVSEQRLRNHYSALNKFLSFIGKTMDDTVGAELLSDFEVESAKFISATCPNNKKTAADKLSILRSWKKSAEQFNSRKKHRQAALALGVATAFQTQLHNAIKASGYHKTKLAEECGVDVSTLHRWLNGRPPQEQTSIPSIHRIEAALDLDRDTLVSLIPKPERLPTPVAKRLDAYSARHGKNTREHYMLRKESFSAELKDEWFQFLRYKTDECPIGLKRSKLGRWQTLPPDLASPELENDPWARPNSSEVCATAQRVFSSVRGYLGFLCWRRSPDGDIARGGLGLPMDDTQTIALFVIPELVQSFFQFMKARSDNIVHTGHAVLAGFITTLVHPEYGYLAQQPDKRRLVEKYAKGRTWEKLCEETMTVCRKWQEASRGNKSRSPEEPINAILRMESPLEPLFRAIADLDEYAEKMTPGGIKKAMAKRNALLLALAIANPLRERTLTVTKYVPADSDTTDETNLYKDDSGTWHLAFSKDHFKNRSAKNEDYDAPLPKWIQARLEEYLSIYRPRLVQRHPESPWLFPSNRDGGKLVDLSGVINRIAKHYVPEVRRMRAHAVRHIVATDYLARNPGQFDVVSQLLHDNFQTVYDTYAHKKKDSAFNAYEEHVNRFYR